MSTTLDTNGDMFSRNRRRFSRGHARPKLRTRKLRALADRANGSSGELDAEILEELLEERTNLIRATIANRNWETHFQPIVDLKSGNAVGTEALSRFADGSARAPDEWFAEAAEVGLGVELEVAALDAAIEQLPRLPSNLYLSLNASVETIMSDGFASSIDDVPAERIVLELTEHTRVNDYAGFGKGLESLRSQGVRLAVDDTGAGFSSLQHVLNLRPDVIKLDVGLTRGIDTDPAPARPRPGPAHVRPRRVRRIDRRRGHRDRRRARGAALSRVPMRSGLLPGPSGTPDPSTERPALPPAPRGGRSPWDCRPATPHARTARRPRRSCRIREIGRSERERSERERSERSERNEPDRHRWSLAERVRSFDPPLHRVGA